MGANASKVEKALGASFPEHERFFGLENFGNTCYCNSVLQALYYCPPFRQRLQAYAYVRLGPNAGRLLSNDSSGGPNPTVARLAHSNDSQGPGNETILTCLAELFIAITHQKRRTGVFAPRKFVTRLRKENELFRGYQQQDAHEFLNYLLNKVAELLASEAQSESACAVPSTSSSQNERKGSDSSRKQDRSLSSKLGTALTRLTSRGTSDAGSENNNSPPDQLPGVGDVPDSENGTPKASNDSEKQKTWVQDIFEGILTNETKCMACETVSSKDECFLDLSVDIEQNSSITQCLRSFSETEHLVGEHKYFCETCCSRQEGQKRMRIKKLPPVLALHLKRFKYIEELQRYRKLAYRVVFPMEMRLFNTSEETEDPDLIYDLFAIVVHVGSGPNQGHYISIVKSYDYWIMFDDDKVDLIDEKDIQSFFGVPFEREGGQTSESGYILFYQARATAAPYTEAHYMQAAQLFKESEKGRDSHKFGKKSPLLRPANWGRHTSTGPDNGASSTKV